MTNPQTTVIEIYVILSLINAFLGIGTVIYQQENPSDSLRSPFNAFPLGSNFTGLDPDAVTTAIQTPTNSTGGIIAWFSDIYSNFEAIITAVLEFTQFFTAGFVIQLLTTMGFPAGFLYIVTVPLALYVMYMVFVMVTNRLGN